MTDRWRERVVDQFSGRGDHADVWRGFDLFLDTEAFLNLGYSEWYRPHVVGSPHRRLAAKLGAEMVTRRPGLHGGRLLDVGCGRGGPAAVFAERFGFDVTGIDLVSRNVATARANARRQGVRAAFAIGDATRLPVRTDAVDACVSVDAVVYVPEKATVFEELRRVARPDGLVVVSDLVARDGIGKADRTTVDAFADAWDMPSLPTLGGYQTTAERAGLDIERAEDVTAHSVARFRKWSGLYLRLADCFPGVVGRALGRWDLDPETVTEQIRRAHAALPHLRHMILYARA